MSATTSLPFAVSIRDGASKISAFAAGIVASIRKRRPAVATAQTATVRKLYPLAPVTAAPGDALARARAEAASAQENVRVLLAMAGIELAAAEKLDESALRARIEQRISYMAADQIAAMGIPPAELPTQSASDAPRGLNEKIKHLNELPPGRERDAFYASQIAPEFTTNIPAAPSDSY